MFPPRKEVLMLFQQIEKQHLKMDSRNDSQQIGNSHGDSGPDRDAGMTAGQDICPNLRPVA